MHKLISTIRNKINSSNQALFIFLLIYRLINSLLIFTMFEPDEFFQNIEPIAYLLTNKTKLTWDFFLGLRSINFSLIFYFPLLISYKLNSISLAYFSIKFINAIGAALTDYFTILVGKFYNINVLPITLLSHGLWLYGCRSHIHNLEMLIGIVSLYLLIKYDREKYKNIFYLRVFVYLNSFVVFLRPTSALLSLIPFFYFCRNRNSFLKILSLIPESISIFLILFLNDYIFYKEVILVPYNFIKVNILDSISHLFGTLPFYFYFFFIFILTGPSLFYFIIAIKKIPLITFIIILFYSFYSLIGHKEMRFLVPLIPFINIIASSNLKIRKFFFYLFFLISIFIGIFHQNISFTIFHLKNIVELEDKKTNILFLTTAYIFPTFHLLANKNVFIKNISNNPNIYLENKSPKLFKRFENECLIVEENLIYEKNVRNNSIDFSEFDILVINSYYYKQCRRKIENEFKITKVFMYYCLDLQDFDDNCFYVLKKIIN